MDSNFTPPNPDPSAPEAEGTSAPEVVIDTTTPQKVKIDRHNRHGDDDKPKPSTFRSLLSLLTILGGAFIVAILLVSFVFRSYQVDGPSMQNTLQNNDKLIIWKVPRTMARLTHHQYVPSRGDIIIFSQEDLSACGQAGPKQLVKRVIGLPGDRVVVSNGVYTVYNKANPKGFNPDKTLSYFEYGKIMPVTSGDIDVTLSSNQLFVSGDNRPDSCDSRAFGAIKTDKVIGKLALRVFPVNKIRIF